MSGERIVEAFRIQARACDDLGSPFMAQLCALFADRLRPGSAIADRLLTWQGDLSPSAQSVPLRMAGALHALRLSGHSGLAALYPPETATDDALWHAVETAMERDAEFLNGFLDQAPQTNEVRRSAVLIPVGHLLAVRFGLPLRLSEMGASAGLNLGWDRFALEGPDWRLGPETAALTLRPDWRGDRPVAGEPRIAERRGCDLNPLSPERDALRLMAYLWPDQPERLTLTRAALAADAAEVDPAEAAEWLAPRLDPVPGQVHMIYTTIAFQYFPEASRADIARRIGEAGRQATQEAPLAWFGMENDGGAGGAGAALSLRLWPGDLSLDLGRADFHGRWVDWRAPSE